MVISTVSGLLDHHSKLKRDEETMSRVTILLTVAEPLLINDVNLQIALSSPIMIKNLVQMLDISISSRRLQKLNEVSKPPLHVKYAIRCLTSCVREQDGAV